MPLANKKILITSGPTWVPIDSMRVISNMSSGEMGRILAKQCRKAKTHVTVIEGPVTQSAEPSGVKVIKYRFFDELKSILNKEAKMKYDAIIHAAAVSDYRLRRASKGKLRSDLRSLRLDLVPTEKLIARIKTAAPQTILVGFKLESRLNRKMAVTLAAEQIRTNNCDLVAVNSVSTSRYEGYLINQDGTILGRGQSRQGMANLIVTTLKKLL